MTTYKKENHMTTYKPGDPDPTPAEDSGVLCDCAATQGLFVCTWPAGHDGPHVAGTGTEIGAVWNTGDQFDDPDQALRLHLATCKGCTFCEATRELFRRVDQDVNGDLANWKPTGFLNAPPRVGHRPDDAPPALTVVPEGLAAPLQTAQSSTSGITSLVADELIRQVREATAQLDAITPPGDRQAIAQEVYNRAQRMGTLEATRSVYDELLNTGMVRQRAGEPLTVTPEAAALNREISTWELGEPPNGATDCRTGTTIPPITAGTPIWERTPDWADNLGICTKEIGHPDLHGNGPETTERHRCDAIYHLDGPLAGIPATKAAMAANIRSAITAEDTLEDGYNSLATALAAKQEFQRILIDGVGTLPGEHLDDFARRIVRFVQRHCPCTPDAPKHAHGVGGYATTPDWERADAPPEQEGKP